MTRLNRVAFLTGTNKEAIAEELIGQGKSLEVIILPRTSQREERLKGIIDFAYRHNIDLLRPSKAQLYEVLSRISPDLLVSAGYPYLLNEQVLSISNYNINIHPTLLPKYRGAATTWYILANGDQQGGVTIHFIDSGMDTGNILCQEAFPLSPFDTLKSYMRKAAEAEIRLIKQALQLLDKNDFVGILQDEDQSSTYNEKRDWRDSRIDPSKSISELYNFIRACDPERFPAFFVKDGQEVGIKLFRLNKPNSEPDTI
jgi:methionyl-tRNA formyltransferase